MSLSIRPLRSLGLLCLVLLVAGGPLAAESPNGTATSPSVSTLEAASPFVALPAAYAEALVSVRFLLAVNMPGVNQESDREIDCLVVDSQGLLLCSDSQLGGFYSVLARLVGRDGHPISARSRDLKVEVSGASGRTEEWGAHLIARDSDRDLAWVQLDDVPEDRRFTAVDFSAGVVPAVGDTIYVLRRLGNFFQSPTVVSELRIAAHLSRPRPLYFMSRPLGHLGMPAFDSTGRPIGLTVTQVPRQGEGDGGTPRGLPGQAGPTEDMVGSLILPADEIVKATQLARETWAADQAEQVP